ncbi:uncharacterized protein, partial [Coffea arabica]|uniref:Uncharacterized protein n=1 Tax=Coffea arabica TaxID=13443 RepID=A0A6P6WVU1_COFAR
LKLGKTFRRKLTSSLDILTSKRGSRDYYQEKNCKPTSFHSHKVVMWWCKKKLPNYVVPDLIGFKLEPYISQCPIEVGTIECPNSSK